LQIEFASESERASRANLVQSAHSERNARLRRMSDPFFRVSLARGSGNSARRLTFMTTVLDRENRGVAKRIALHGVSQTTSGTAKTRDKHATAH